jgi:hypothetical protein
VDPDADQVAGDVVAFRQPVQRLAGQIFLRDLTLKLNAVCTVSCHGSLFENPTRLVNPSCRSVHPQGRTPQGHQICMPKHRPRGPWAPRGRNGTRLAGMWRPYSETRRERSGKSASSLFSERSVCCAISAS